MDYQNVVVDSLELPIDLEEVLLGGRVFLCPMDQTEVEIPKDQMGFHEEKQLGNWFVQLMLL